MELMLVKWFRVQGKCPARSRSGSPPCTGLRAGRAGSAHCTPGSVRVARQQALWDQAPPPSASRCSGFQLPQGHWVLVADMPRQLREQLAPEWGQRVRLALASLHKKAKEKGVGALPGTQPCCALAPCLLLGGRDKKVGPCIPEGGEFL